MNRKSHSNNISLSDLNRYHRKLKIAITPRTLGGGIATIYENGSRRFSKIETKMLCAHYGRTSVLLMY